MFLKEGQCPQIDVFFKNGQRIPFSCENSGYLTNINKGFSHQPYSPTLGNVLDGPLVDDGYYSVWLEHVVAKGSNEEFYWLMWYSNADGKSTIPLSSVFKKDGLQQMVSRLMQFVP